MISIRGATTVLEDNKTEVLKVTEEMLKKIIKYNNVEICDIISIVFTSTKDITSVYPAVIARKMGITSAALICMQEMHVEGSLPKCIRVMVTIDTKKKQKEAVHVYLNEAEKLRPDIVKPQASV